MIALVPDYHENLTFDYVWYMEACLVVTETVLSC